ncbi:MAG: hypothetical protein ABFR53_10495 [Actinomycetota bacterium]
MTPFTPTTIDTHITVYDSELRGAIHRAKALPGALHSLRRHIARGLVRTGAWLLPDKPEVIAGTVFVLPGAPPGDTDRKAA